MLKKNDTRDLVIRMAEFFKAFGDPTRLKIIQMLASNPARKLCVGAIASRLGVTQPAVSQHLKVLKNIGLIEPNREGFRVHYALDAAALAEFRKKLDALLTFTVEHYPCEDECTQQEEDISETAEEQ